MSIAVVNEIKTLREIVRDYRKQGKTIALVPTMGCLHEGHKSLMQKAHSIADVTIISVFVNPIQFCPGEDYDKYPRTLDADKIVAESAGVDVIFAPSVNEMYPGLFRPMIVRNSRYNQHVAKGACIIEVGATANTLGECLLSMQCLANVLEEVCK